MDRKLDKSTVMQSHSGIVYSIEKRLTTTTNSGQKQNQTKYYLSSYTFVKNMYMYTHILFFQAIEIMVFISGE